MFALSCSFFMYLLQTAAIVCSINEYISNISNKSIHKCKLLQILFCSPKVMFWLGTDRVRTSPPKTGYSDSTLPQIDRTASKSAIICRHVQQHTVKPWRSSKDRAPVYKHPTELTTREKSNQSVYKSLKFNIKYFKQQFDLE